MHVARTTRRIPLPVLFAISLLVATLAVLAPPGTARAVGPRPTIVLIHGAFFGPSAWTAVASELRTDGYQVVTPKLALNGVASDVATVRAALNNISGPKILVGHSYGGFVVSDAAAGRTDIRALVFTAAFVPARGDSIVKLGLGYKTPSFLAPGHLAVGLNLKAIIKPIYFRQDFAQDLTPAVAAAMAASQGPTSLLILATPSGAVGWHGLPSWYAVSGGDRVIDPALQRWMAKRAGSTTVTFDGASHAGGFTRYADQFTQLIETAAAATG